MKRLFLLLSVIFLMSGCYDDSALWESVNDHESRISKLEKLCNEMNANISSLKTIVEALQTNDYVTSVTPVTEGGKEVGYTITFSKSGSITIYHGKDGADGAPGADGKDGTDGQTPVIGVRQDTDGVWYWTLNGEWLLDDSGNKIPTTGKDGADGEDGKDGVDGSDSTPGTDGSDGQDGAPGQDGKDGITPQLKIEDGYWYVSYDNGASWTEVGKAVGENGKDGEDGADGDSFFRSVTQDDSNVYFTLADGTVIALPKKVSLSIEFDSEDLVVMAPNSTRDIRYTITSVLPDVEVEALSSGDVQAKVVPDETGESTGVIRVRIPGDSIDEYCKVVVLVSNGEKVIMRTLTFEEEAIEVVDEAKVTANAEGGEVELLYLSNVECEVVIPEEAKSWISVAPATKVLQQRSVNVVLQPNPGYYRSATVTIKAKDGSLSLEYVIEQDGDLGVNIDPTQIPDNEIWYTTTDGKIYDIHKCLELYSSQPFDVEVISNTYQNGVGVIKCKATIKSINFCAFNGSNNTNNITTLHVPNSVETIAAGAISRTMLKTFHVPDNLKTYGWSSSSSGGNSNSEMECFTGKHVSEDGRCIILDNILCAFAPKKMTNYTIPKGVVGIGQGAFREYSELESIVLTEGLEDIQYAAFQECKNLKSVTFPLSLQSIGETAFKGCYSIEGFYGNEKFHSSDNRCLIHTSGIANEPNTYGKWIQLFAGNGLSEYAIPEGIVGIGEEAFVGNNALKSLTLPSSLMYISSSAFGSHEANMVPIEAIYGTNTSDDHCCLIVDGELRSFAVRTKMEKYIVPDNVTSIYSGAFSCSFLQEISMNDNVTQLGVGCFSSCPELKTVTLSAFIETISGNPFEHCEKLQSVYLRALVPPLYADINMTNISNTLQFFVPSQSLSAYRHVGRRLFTDRPWGNAWSPYLGWHVYRDYLVGYNYSDHPTPDIYISSDFSKDGDVTTLQTATKGNGIDIVLMGDAYSDRQIADGTYKTDMENLYSNLFTEEPYKSFKDYFNVYYINVVSITEVYGLKGANGALLGGYFGDGTLVGGDDNAVFDYALKAITPEEMDESLLIVAMNSDNYAGTCYMYYPDSSAGYGNGMSVSYFPKGGDQETFAQLLHHEACGHGFAKLADEYAYEDMGTVPGDYATLTAWQQDDWGWWKNVDFTNDPSQVRWSYFLEDERYQYDGLGCFEGGLTYWSGVWRPTENSIMRYNTGGFNAPSREAIWYRIHKLAYGDSWEYDYEDFVEYDAINRASSASAPQKSRGNYVERTFEPTAPPVIVNKSWREVK